MKIDFENYKVVHKCEQDLLLALLKDIEHNSVLPHNIEIHWQDWHDEYSPERTDPCPDFYGTYGLKWEGYDDFINKYMDIDTLDEHLCTLCLAFEQLNEIYERETNS